MTMSAVDSHLEVHHNLKWYKIKGEKEELSVCGKRRNCWCVDKGETVGVWIKEKLLVCGKTRCVEKEKLLVCG